MTDNLNPGVGHIYTGEIMSRSSAEHGATAVEAAAVLAMLLATVFVCIEYGRIAYGIVTAQTLAAEGARRASASAILGDNTSPTEIENYVINRSRVLGLNLTANDIKVCKHTPGGLAPADFSNLPVNCSSEEQSAPGDWVTVKISLTNMIALVPHGYDNQFDISAVGIARTPIGSGP